MGTLDKLKKIGKIAIPIATTFIPFGGKAKSVIDIIKNNIDDEKDPQNQLSLKVLGEVTDVHTEVLTEHEQEIRKIKARLGI
jgi:hypothetical protein